MNLIETLERMNAECLKSKCYYCKFKLKCYSQKYRNFCKRNKIEKIPSFWNMQEIYKKFKRS